MARDRDTGTSAAFYGSQPQALVASAQRKDLRSSRGGASKVQKESWQQRCWYFYDTVGEFYYGMNWLGNLLSRAKLIIVKGDNHKPVRSGPAFNYLQSLFGGTMAQGEMLRQLGIHLGVAGEGYVVGTSSGANPDDWMVASSQRLSGNSAEGFRLDGVTLSSPLVLRIFKPHPLDPNKATSSSRPALPVLSILEGLAKRSAANIDSRLTGNGLLLLPSEVNFPSLPIMQNPGEPDQTDIRAGANGIQDVLIEAASIAMLDPEAASAKIPIVATMPGDQIDGVKHLTFWSPFDEHAGVMEDKAIRRLALALDMPPEALTGTGEMNHWNAWQLEEAAIKVHTEPMLQLITDALTTGYLWPLLDADNVAEAHSYRIASDTTELRLRPNRSKEAQELYDRGALSIEVMLRENGFEPEDKMADEELRSWFLRKVASGSTTPELVAEALRALRVPIDIPETTAPIAEARPTPSLEEHPEREIPNDGVPPEITAAAELLVYRALERAGNRLKNKGHRPPNGTGAADLYTLATFKSTDIDDLLADAWSPCALFGMDLYEDLLDSYARSLLATKEPHTREALNGYLKKGLSR